MWQHLAAICSDFTSLRSAPQEVHMNGGGGTMEDKAKPKSVKGGVEINKWMKDKMNGLARDKEILTLALDQVKKNL